MSDTIQKQAVIMSVTLNRGPCETLSEIFGIAPDDEEEATFQFIIEECVVKERSVGEAIAESVLNGTLESGLLLSWATYYAKQHVGKVLGQVKDAIHQMPPQRVRSILRGYGLSEHAVEHLASKYDEARRREDTES
jgi:hypothetical protein